MTAQPRSELEHDLRQALSLADERARYIAYLESFFPNGIPDEGPEGTQAEFMIGEKP